MQLRFTRSLLIVAACAVIATAAGPSRLDADESYVPSIAEASHEGEQAIPRIRVPEGFQVELWAAEPLLANPVAFCIDERGRIYVAETYRQKKGVEDNRDHMDWLDDDLAAMTVDDRLAYFRKHLGERVAEYARHHDRIRLLVDRDGDGKADDATVFAGGFHEIVEGTGAGLIARGDSVWYTNIPHLWQLRDTDGDGQADARSALQSGYGVRVAFRGHDAHGLRFGPDGKLYFSIGDRGLNVETQEGTRLVYPDQGAVLRCNPDGTELEVVASGMRNPQELAFDQYGNLFTGENNSDSGDKARWVYVVDGGESGWRMSFQYLPDRGPWNREKLWHPQHDGQAAYIVPPIANFADGPSGLTYNPGTGFPARYAEHFFLCDFRGGHVNSGVRSFALKPNGASFELVDAAEFAWSILATDVDFGPDGAMYVSDWVEGWDGPGKGRIYRITAAEAQRAPAAVQTAELFRAGFAHRSGDELARLLSHPNMQIRLEAQFALAARGDAALPFFSQVARAGDNRLARLHALWGLGQLARHHPGALETPRALLTDADAEVRAQAAKVVGEARDTGSEPAVRKLLADGEPRVRYFAALAYGRLGPGVDVDALFELLRDNADRDPYLRHAAVMSLARTSRQDEVARRAGDASPAVRMGVLLAWRRNGNPEIARFLDDSEHRLVDEAARAINDVPIVEAMPALAALAGRGGLSEPTLWRVINANFRAGTQQNALAVAGLAARSTTPDALRVEALRALEAWASPSSRDRVLGLWRPLGPRDVQAAPQAFRQSLAGVFVGSEAVRRAATSAAVKLQVSEVAPALLALLSDQELAPQTRVSAIRALSDLKDDRLSDALTVAFEDRSPFVRAAARRALAGLQPAAAVESLAEALDRGELPERQAALATLAEMQSEGADAILLQWMDKLLAGQVDEPLQLDLLEAAARRGTDECRRKSEQWAAMASTDDALAAYRVTLAGGDAERGRAIFFEKSEVSCVRCHKVQGRGGEVGPDLSKIAGTQKRDYLLEALVLPDRQIAKGFDTVVIATESGKVHTGIIKSADEREIKLMTAEGNLVIIPRAEIDEQVRGKSAMPEDLIKKLTRSEVRDLLEFLAGLK